MIQLCVRMFETRPQITKRILRLINVAVGASMHPLQVSCGLFVFPILASFPFFPFSLCLYECGCARRCLQLFVPILDFLSFILVFV